MDGVLDELKKAQDAVHVELLATKVGCRQAGDVIGISLGLGKL
jgi:hypothetical protein